MDAGHMRFSVLIWSALILLLGCARPEQAIIGIENPEIPVSSVEGIKRHDIYVMTTRQRSPDAALLFSGERSDTLGLAKVTVTLPPSHQQGQLERAVRLPPDPQKHMTVVDPVVFQSDGEFTRDLNRFLRDLPYSDKSVLVFVHGYNTTFTDAVLRLGQFVDDSSFDGVPVLFSWASAGKLLDYVYDQNSTLAARNDLIEAGDILVASEARSIDLVAHSMGNFLAVEAMRQAKLQNKHDRSGKLKNVILASADIDLDVFTDQMSVFPRSERRFYVLISEDDKALATSRFLARDIPRVGDADVASLEALGVTVIDLTEVQDTESLNHSKFSESPGVVQVIGSEMLKGDSLHTAPKTPGVLASAYRQVTGTVESSFGMSR